MLKEKHLVKTDFYKVNIDTAKNVSLGANKSTAVVVPEVTCTAFEKIDVEVPEVDPTNESKNDVPVTV